ncbi:MAG: trypsin-like peptidase domain-containing protein [bacterium]|nr:trypsin-like peptidase domain-containing protein [bacterium]
MKIFPIRIWGIGGVVLLLLFGATLVLAETAPRTEDEAQTIDVYKKVNRSVVNVSTQATSYDFFGPVYQQGSGSGVVIDAEEGLILTNHHVIAGAEMVQITFAQGETVEAKVIGADADNDLALMKVVTPPEGLVAADLGDSASLEVGQRVMAIGNPFGLQRTLSTGIISSLGRSIRSESGQVIEDVIQIDAAINPGNSGGPLLDMAGRVVGINTAILSRVGESAGIGFAIPVDMIRQAVPQLIKYGKILRPKIGVILGDTDVGPVFQYVEPGSPAAEAGLQGARKQIRRGSVYLIATDYPNADFVIAVNGKQVASKAEVMAAIDKTSEGEKVSFLVRRGYGRGSTTRGVEVKPELR